MPKKCPRCLNLLGEGTRAKIIQRLRKKPNRVSEIEACFSLTQPTISHHLKVLKKNRNGIEQETRPGNLLFLK